MSILEKQVQTVQDTSCETTGCCSTTDEGSAICVVPSTSIRVSELAPVTSKRILSAHLAASGAMWQKIRGMVMFIVACIASPCCTPLIVPTVLALLAGTPVAVWMGQNLGWVYGGLTILSVISFVLAFRWMNKQGSRRASSLHLSSRTHVAKKG